MPNIEIVKYKIRRGTDTQRRTVILDQGELAYTTDTKRLFIGTGTLSGGGVIGNKIHYPITNISSLSTINAEKGDLVLVNSIYHQLTGSNSYDINSWKNVGVKLDPSMLEYDGSNRISIQDDSITPNKFKSSNITDGLKIESNQLKVDLNTNFFDLSSNRISIKGGSIGKREIGTDLAGNGLAGGNGSPLDVNYDSDIFYIKTGNLLSLSALPGDSLKFESLDSDWIGNGLIYDLPNKKIKSNITGIQGNPLTQDLSGRIGLASGLVSGTNEMSMVQSDQYGRVINNRTSIYDTVSCLSATGGGALETLFNGTANQTLSGSMPNLTLTTFTVLSSNSGGSVSLELSSAGFLVFEGNSNARQDGKYVGRYAIPIFSY